MDRTKTRRKRRLISIPIVGLFFLLAGAGALRPQDKTGAVQAQPTLTPSEAKALEAERRNNWEQASNFYREASTEARVNGNFQKAIAHANKALDAGGKAQEPVLQARAILPLVFAFYLAGDRAQVSEWTKKGIEIAKKLPAGAEREFLEAAFYRVLGGEFYGRGEYAKAIEYISYSLRMFESVSSYHKSIGASSRFGPFVNYQLVITLHRLGRTYHSAGNFAEAIQSYEKGLMLIRQTGFKTEFEADLYHGLGRVYLSRKEYPRAQDFLNKALDSAEKLRHATIIQSASSDLADLFLQTGRAAEAIKYYRKAIDTIESTRSLLESEQLRTSFFEDKGQTYGGMILVLLAENNPAEAFNYAERARSRAFLDILGSKVRLARSEALLAEESRLQSSLAGVRAKLEGAGDGGREQREKALKELEAAEKAYADFLSNVRKENREQASLMTVEPLTLGRLQELLDPGVTVLEYFVLRDGGVVWVVEKDRANFVRLGPSRTELVAKVSALRESITATEQREKFKRASEDLYRDLIEPALPYVRGKELLIVSHDVLHYLPFQALLSPQGRYLVQDYPVRYLSSASLMQFTKEKKRAARDGLLAFGNPDLGDAAYDLRFAEREAKEAASIFEKSAVYLRGEATKRRAIVSSPSYDVLHFAVHGELKEDDPLGSSLLLAGEGSADGKLTVGEIFSLNLRADAVVLSACETGLGKIAGGDEVIGLTRAFIYAGTPSVVTTLWKVNDRASYELMREFYRQMKTGNKSEALRLAQLKTMKEFPEPFYWAAYQLTGEP